MGQFIQHCVPRFIPFGFCQNILQSTYPLATSSGPSPLKKVSSQYTNALHKRMSKFIQKSFTGFAQFFTISAITFQNENNQNDIHHNENQSNVIQLNVVQHILQSGIQ